MRLPPWRVLFSHSVVTDSMTPWTATHQAPLSFTTSRSLLKGMSMESVMPSNHLVLCHPLLLLTSIKTHSIRVFSNESALCISWPKYWSFSFSISPSSQCSGLAVLWEDCHAFPWDLGACLEEISVVSGLATAVGAE